MDPKQPVFEFDAQDTVILQKVFSSLLSNNNFDDITQQIVDLMVHELKALGGILFLLDEEKQEVIPYTTSQTKLIRTIVQKVLGGRLREFAFPLNKGEDNYIKQSFLTQELYTGTDIKKFVCPPLSYAVATTIQTLAQIKSTISVPVVFREHVLGVLWINFHEKDIPESTLKRLEHFTHYTALALNNALSFRNLEKELQQNKELSQIKTNFLSVVSHQLRTPISAVRGSLALVLEDFLTEERAKGDQMLEYARHFVKQAILANENLFDTSEHMLAATELIDKAIYRKSSSIDLAGFLKDRLAKAQNFLDIQQSKVSIDLDVDSSIPENMQSDRRLLAKIIDVFLANACLYTEEGHIAIKAKIENNQIQICVKDTGIGIPSKEQQKVYDRFVRLSNAVNLVPDGSGLGLYLAQRYSEVLGGEIHAQSEEGKGSEFCLLLPLEEAEDNEKKNDADESAST